MKISRVVWVGALGALVLGSGCEKAAPVEAEKGQTVAVNAQADAGSAPAAQAEAAEAGPTLQEAAAQLLVDWEKAQDTGNFEAYQALYASKFTGVKRVGHRASTFDREGWMVDRGRMFQNEMKVTVEEPEVVVTGATAVIRLTQRWESQDFADVGTKVLVVQQEGGAAKIVREEMLESNVLGQEERRFDPNRWVPVVYDSYLVLSDEVSPQWMTENHRLVGETPMHGLVALAETAVDVAHLPVTFKKLEGRTFDLAGKTACRSTVQGFRVLSHAQPHFGMVQDWDSREKSKENNRVLAGEIADLASGSGQLLVAKLDQSCAGAVWGQAVQMPGDAEFSAADEDPLRARVMAAAFKTKAWARMEKDAQEFGKTDWWSDEDVTLRAFSLGNEKYAVMSLKVGIGCNEFYGEFSGIFDVSGPQAVLLASNDDGPFFAPVAVLKRDAGVVFISEDRAATLEGGRVRTVLSWGAPYFDCPC